jgi:hypothetical protein
MELEKSLLPRELYSILYADRATNLDKLKELNGTRVILESIPDFEAKNAAGYIAFALEQAGWTIVKEGVIDTGNS